MNVGKAHDFKRMPNHAGMRTWNCRHWANALPISNFPFQPFQSSTNVGPMLRGLVRFGFGNFFTGLFQTTKNVSEFLARSELS